jgi:rsbT co-antagonist protein RsbR
VSPDLAKYRETVEAQKEELLAALAKLGIEQQYDIKIDLPPEDTPLADLYVAVQTAADNLKLVSERLREKVEEVEQHAAKVVSQSAALMELSTPVIQVFDDVLVLPLIGAIDTARALQIMEQLLQGICERQATIAIIDVTGVPIVDTAVANHLMKTIEAARMLGAQCILTGVSPSNAQTLVKLGVTSAGMETQGTLQAALEYALQKTHKSIQEE